MVRREGDALVLHEQGNRHPVAGVKDLPAALGGAAHFNLLNALAAIGAARELGVSLESIRTGLSRFHGSPEDNPGRLNLFEKEGVRALVDFAHNPHGMQALLKVAAAMEPDRLLVVIGQAGDRDDDSIRQLAQVTAAARPDRVIVKEMTRYLRGRSEGEVVAMLEEELLLRGVSAEAMERASGELDAARRALEWSRPGDLLLVICHSRRGELLSFFQEQLVSG